MKKFSFLRDQWMEIKASLLVRMINIQLNKKWKQNQENADKALGGVEVKAPLTGYFWGQC